MRKTIITCDGCGKTATMPVQNWLDVRVVESTNYRDKIYELCPDCKIVFVPKEEV